jgi:uncharacterized protein involved in exopolysaccharide biosynthesis
MHEHEAELIDYLRILWRQKWVILVTVAVAVAAAWGATRTIAPTYRTETSLLLLPPLSSQLGAEAIGSRLTSEAYEELAVSTSLLQMVSEALEPRVSVSAGSLKSRLSVSVKRLSSEGELLLSATVRGSDPDQLPDIAKAWTAAFADTYGELFQDRNARSYDYISENYAETQAELAALIEERTVFLADHPLSALRAEASALQTVLQSNHVEILRARQELESVEAYLATREGNRTPQLPTHVFTSEVDPYTLLGAIVFGLSASDYRNLIEARIADLERHTITISEELVAKQQEIDSAEAALGELDRRIALLQQAYESLAVELQDAKIAMAETPEPIRVIDEPVVTAYSTTSRKSTNIAVAGFLGLMAGTLLAFFVDYLARVHEQEGTLQPAEGRGSEQLGSEQADEVAETGSTEDRKNSPPQEAHRKHYNGQP